MDANPYQPPTAAVTDEVAASDSTIALRRAHLRHEVQIKSIGSLYLFASALLALGPIALAVHGTRSAGIGVPLRLIVPLAISLAAALFVLGIGFHRLQPWVRIPGGLLSVLGLLAFPFGSLLHAWILYLMFGKAGRVVLDPSYEAVVAATPHVRARKSLGDRIAPVLLLVLLLVLAILLIRM